MGAPVCTVGHRFEGYCTVCQTWVGGVMVDGEFPTIEGMNICVTGSNGIGDCGHPTQSIGLSAVWKIEGKQVVRIGDPVAGVINGQLVTGSDFVTSD